MIYFHLCRAGWREAEVFQRMYHGWIRYFTRCETRRGILVTIVSGGRGRRREEKQQICIVLKNFFVSVRFPRELVEALELFSSIWFRVWIWNNNRRAFDLCCSFCFFFWKGEGVISHQNSWMWADVWEDFAGRFSSVNVSCSRAHTNFLTRSSRSFSHF